MKKFIIAILAGLWPWPAQAETQAYSGKASYYARSYEGRPMANGQKYDSAQLTLACWELPLGTRVKITYVSAAGHIRVAAATVTDRGPARWVQEQDPLRRFDFSYALFRLLENPSRGLINVKVEVIK